MPLANAFDSYQVKSTTRNLQFTTQLGISVYSFRIDLVLSDDIGTMVKLVVGDLTDLKSAELLASELIDKDSLADQYVFLTNRAPVFAETRHSKPSSYQVHEVESLFLSTVREPEYYNSGLKEHRIIKREATASVILFDYYKGESPNLSMDGNLLRNWPLMLLHLHDRPDEALAQVKCLVKFSQNRGRLIDLPN